MSTEAIVLNLNDSPLWAPYKALYHAVNNALVAKDVDAIPDLEAALKSHKPDFICLLKNPVRSQIHREAVKKASTTGIAVSGQPGLQTLNQQLVDEALLISDMFDLNELTSLELLIAGQQQQPHFPGLSRGPVAMLLYYDGQRCLVSALRTLVQAREGRTWTVGLSTELTSLVTNFTNQLKEEGMIMNIIGLIEKIDIRNELDLLHKNRALGGPRYRKQVTDLIAEIKQSLAEIIFCWACQGSLTQEEVLRLLNHLIEQTNVASDGSLDETSMILTMALLYIIDVKYLQTCEEQDPLIQKLNLVVCPGLISAVQKVLCSENAWHVEDLKSVILFAWGVTIRTLSQFPLSSISISFSETLEDDERLIDLAIENSAFKALNKLIVQNSLFHQEEYFLKRIHSLITDFIVLMPVKVKDLRNRNDESAKIIAANMQQGLDPPAHLSLHFQHFLTLISKTYENNPLGLDLALDYWCPVDNTMEPTFTQRPTQRQVALFKFVRLAGDLLPAALFVSYHEMLASLSSSKLCAHHCFNLLKMNSRNVVGSHYSIVSWDHFFSTLHKYYSNLCEELAVAPDARHIYRQKMLTKGITPQEVAGLVAVLNLISQVTKFDEVARVTLSENSDYMPCDVFLGLITCSVPAVLKACLIRCLAAFATSADIAFNIWHGLEAAQIIPTVQSTSVYYPSGILMEIEEVETRNEEYPITIAVLELISMLLEHSFPFNLGVGQRQPGIQPYLDFVRDKILLRCNSKSYKNQEEKWKIIALCLDIMTKVLRNYQVPANPRPHNKAVEASTPSIRSHPGYGIVSEMLQDSNLLKMVLLILDEGVRILDTYMPYPGQKYLENGTLLALNMLCLTLMKQDGFLSVVRESNSSLLVTSLENLLMSINPRSGQVDHMFMISKYITYNTTIPQHSLLALRILVMLCASRQVAQHLVTVFEIDPKESEVLLNGFVECLEVDVTSEEDESNKLLNEEDSVVTSRNKARQQLLVLMLNCLKYPGPNLSHYLLGFNLRRPINQTEIQEPGVMGSRRTCLHAVLSFLDAGTSSNTGPVNVFKSPSAAALAYQLIYTLCTDKDTSGPVLRYLRSTHDFFYRHLQFLPFKSKEKYDPKVLSQQSWLLKALAIELRVTSAHHQRSHVHRLLLSFLDDKPSVENVSVDGVTEPLSGMTTIASFSFIQPNTGPLRRKLMRILDSLDFQQSIPSAADWDYFGWKEVQKVFKECETLHSSGVPLIDVEELHRRLEEELSMLQNDPRQNLIKQEVASVLQYAFSINNSRLIANAKKQSFDAWRQVTEVLLLACPLDMLGSEKKHQMVLEVSQELLRRVMSEDFLPELMPPASGVILTLMATLRHGVFASIAPYKAPFLLPDTNPLFSPLTLPKQSAPVAITQYSSLLVVLKAVIECLLQTGSGLQRVRANFYTAFLNLLCIVQKPCNIKGVGSSSIESAVLDQESENRKLRAEYTDTILSFGEAIMEVVCRDACSGHDVTKMLALAVLDMVVSLDSRQLWLAFLVSKGYLRHILDSLMRDDEQLQALLNRNNNSYRIFYVFESKMALLSRIGSTDAGALALLRNGAIGKLSECRVLDMRPDPYVPLEMRTEGENWILPNLINCYRQILKSIMKLILSIMMSLRMQHREANLQLLGYIAYNMDFFLSILRNRATLDSSEGLEELSLVTAVLSRAALEDPNQIAGDTVLLETRGQLLHLRQNLISLLPCLLTTEATPQWSHSIPSQSEADATSNVKLPRLQIAAHILRLCCSAVATSDMMVSRNIPLGKTPDFSLLVSLLYQCSTQLQSGIENHKLLLLRLQSLATLTSAELAEYLSSEVQVEHMTSHQQRELAQQYVFRLLQYQVKEVSLLTYIIESSAFLLLKHLEYFLLHSKKSVLGVPFTAQQDRGVSSMRRLQDYRSPRSTPETAAEDFLGPVLDPKEYESFKAEVSSALSESFFRKIQVVEQHFNKGRSHVSFLEAIMNRLKRLVRLQIQ